MLSYVHKTPLMTIFAPACLQVWNNVMSYLRQDVSYRQLKWQLKTFLFWKLTYCDCLFVLYKYLM